MSVFRGKSVRLGSRSDWILQRKIIRLLITRRIKEGKKGRRKEKDEI